MYRVKLLQRILVLSTNDTPIAAKYKINFISLFYPDASRELMVPEDELVSKSWWKRNLKGCSYILSDEHLWNDLKKQIHSQIFGNYILPTSVVYSQIGWQHHQNIWKFSFGNCVVTSEGISNEEYTIDSTIDLPYKDITLSEQSQHSNYETLSRYLLVNPDIFYLVWISNIAALFNEILKSQNLAPAIVLCLHGPSGSGKTEVAKAIGTVFVERGHGKDLSPFPADANPRNLIKWFRRHRSVNVLLDDVKRERANRLRESSNSCINTMVRSIFAQKITDTFSSRETSSPQDLELDIGGLITSEVPILGESTIARMVYVPFPNVVNIAEQSSALTYLQLHPELLGEAMAGFIQYLCRSLQTPDYIQSCVSRIRNLQEQAIAHFGTRNGSRLARNLASLQFCSEQWQAYGKSLGIENDPASMDDIFVKIMKRTEALLDAGEHLWNEAMTAAIGRLNIEIAQFHDISPSYPSQMATYSLCLKESYNAIYIQKPGAFLHSDSTNRPLLIVEKEALLQLLREEILQRKKTYDWDVYLKYRVTTAGLKESGMLVSSKNRGDGYSNNEPSYPKYYKSSDYIDELNVIVLNPYHPAISKIVRELQEQSEHIAIVRAYADDYCIQTCESYRSNVRKTIRAYLLTHIHDSQEDDYAAT